MLKKLYELQRVASLIGITEAELVTLSDEEKEKFIDRKKISI